MASWCISLYLKLSFEPFHNSQYASTSKEISNGVYLCINLAQYPESVNIDDAQLQSLLIGLNAVSEKINNHTPYKNNTLIVLHSVNYGYCDIQEEGFTHSIIEWSAKAFGFEAPIITVSYDKKINKYLFNFENLLL